MRIVKSGLLAGIALVGLVAASGAEDFPNKPINVVVPFSAGGSTDAVGRLLAAEMGKILGQDTVVRNETGAGGTVGTASVADSAADGYTLLYTALGPISLQPWLQSVPYAIDSFDFVCRVSNDTNVLMAKRDGPFKTVDDVIAAAKERPGELVFVAVPGGIPQISMLAMNDVLGLQMTQINGDSATAARYIAGDTAHFHSAPPNNAVQFELDVVAVFGDERLESLPDAPTFKELGHEGLSFSTWFGLLAPAGLPDDVLARLRDACGQATKSESFAQGLAALNTELQYLDGEAFGTFVRDGYDQFGELIKRFSLAAK